MRKIRFLGGYYFLFLAWSAVITTVSGLFLQKNPWIPLIVSFTFAIVSTVLAFVLRQEGRTRFAVCSLLNSTALGFALRAWYIARHLHNTIGVLLLAAVAAVAVWFLYYLISLIPFVNRHYRVFFWILTGLLVCLYIVGVILTKTSYFSTLGFDCLVGFFMTFCMGGDEKNLTEKILMASFSVWIVAIIVLIFLLDGDGLDLDFLELFDLGPTSPRTKTPPTS